MSGLALMVLVDWVTLTYSLMIIMEQKWLKDAPRTMMLDNLVWITLILQSTRGSGMNIR